MRQDKTYSECVNVEQPLSDVQFLYGKIEQLVKENEGLKDTIRQKDISIQSREEELVKSKEQCDYAYAFCYELQKELADIKAVMKRPKKEIIETIEKSEDNWSYCIKKYLEEFTKPYNDRKKEIWL